MLKTKVIDLVSNAVIQPATWDADKPYLAGRMREKTINGFQSVGAPLTKYIDTLTPFTFTPGGADFLDATNGRLFVCGAISTAGVGQILLYDFDLLTNTATNGRRIGFNIAGQAATTHTLKEMHVHYMDADTIRIVLDTTGSVVNNGGVHVINAVDLADFISGPGFPVFPVAFNETNAKKVYKYTTTNQMGFFNQIANGPENVAVSTGIWAEGNTLKVLNGAAAAVRALHFDLSTDPIHVGTVVTLSLTSPGVVTHAGHNFNNGDLVAFTTTGALPTGLLPFPTVFAVRGSIPGVSYNLSTTASVTPINFTGAQSGVHTVGRAWGETSNAYLGTSGDMLALIPGVITGSRNARLKVEPVGPHAGQNYIFVSSSTTLTKIKTADFAIGSTSFTSLEQVTIASPGLTAASVLQSAWEDHPLVNKFLFVTNVAKVVEKDFLNAQHNRVFGSVLNVTLENTNPETVNFGGPAILSMVEANGFLIAQLSTIGARGLIIMDFRSDGDFDFSYILSPVIKANKSVLCFLDTIEALFSSTGTVRLYYRSENFDENFVEGVGPGEFKQVEVAEELSVLLGNEVQFAVKTDCALEDASTHAQLIALKATLLTTDLMDEHYSLYEKFSASENESPFYAAFRLQYPFEASEGGMPSELVVDVVNDTDDIIHSISTVADIAKFTQSTNDLTFAPLVGTPSNTFGAVLRALIDSPAPGALRARIRKA